MFQVIVNGLIAGAAYALIGISFGLIFQVSKFFNFAHGAIYTLAAYTAYYLIQLCGWKIWVGIPLAVIIASVIGGGINIFIYEPMLRRRSSSITLLVASLGILVALQNAISMIFGNTTKLLRTGDSFEGIKIFSAYITPFQITTIGVAILFSFCLWLWLNNTKLGKMTRAVAISPELSTIVGIHTNRIITLTFTVGSALAAIAAILIGYDTDLTPMMGFRALLVGVVAVIIGGIESPLGCFLGGIFVGLIQHLGAWWLPTQWQDAVLFFVLILFLIFRPQGFFGRPLNRVTV
jgi:branched-chain amino acid transport system permease protein